MAIRSGIVETVVTVVVIAAGLLYGSDVVPGGSRLLLPGVAARHAGNETVDASEAHEDDRD